VFRGRQHGGGTWLRHDGHRLDTGLILDKIGKTEVAEGADIATDAANDDIVILGGGEIAAAGFGLTHDGFGEVVEGAGVGTGAVKPQGNVGPGRVDLAPSLNDVLR